MYRKSKKGKYKHIPKLNLPKAELGMQIDPGMSGNDTWSSNVDYSNYVASDQEIGKKFKHGVKGFIAPALEWVGADKVGDKWREQAAEEGYGKSYGVGSGMGEIGSAVGKFFTGDFAGMAGDITEMTGDFTEARGYGQMKKGNKSRGEAAIQAGESINAIGGAVSKAGYTGMASNIGNIGKGGTDVQSFDTFSDGVEPQPLYAKYGTQLPRVKGLEDIIGTGTLPSYNYGGKLKPVAGADEAMEYEGPSHEEGGIPVDGAGIPTDNPMEQEIEVEDGEVLADGEVWSTEKIPGEKETFAQKKKRIDKMRNVSTIDKNTQMIEDKNLSLQAERFRQEKGIKENEVMMAKYGKKLKKANPGIVLDQEMLDQVANYNKTNPEEVNETSPIRLDLETIKNNVSLDNTNPEDPKKGSSSDMTTGNKAQLAGLFAAPAVNFGMARGIGKDVIEQQRKNFVPREQRISTKDQERTARQQGATITKASSQVSNPGVASALRSAGLSGVTKAVQEAQFKGKQLNTELAMKHDANLERMEEFNIATDLRNQEDARNRRDLKRTAVATGAEQIGTGLEKFGMQKNTALENKVKFAALNGTFENFKVTATYDELIKQGKTDKEIEEIYQYFKIK